MVKVEEALRIILSEINPMPPEKIGLMDALGRVIGEDIYSPRNIPPWDNSAMDGFAVRYKDCEAASKENPVILKVVDEVRAGEIIKRELKEGEAIKIMTGGVIPQGADTVIKIEDVGINSNTIRIENSLPLGKDIREKGEDLKKGDKVISEGTLLMPAHIGLLASIGRSMILVYQKPKVAILATGDELADIDEVAAQDKIINSNNYTLFSQVKEIGAIPILIGIAKDNKADLCEKLIRGRSSDLIVSSAGVSVGEYDFVKDALAELGAEMRFWKVAMKPGQPLTFGSLWGKPVFGLPGNPVSSMVSFEEFVRPTILKMMGHKRIFRPTIKATLKEDIERTRGFKHFLRAEVSVENGEYYVKSTGGQGSGILTSMARANGLMIVSEDKPLLKRGERILVQLLDRTFELPINEIPF